jgi:hypothetical protein
MKSQEFKNLIDKVKQDADFIGKQFLQTFNYINKSYLRKQRVDEKMKDLKNIQTEEKVYLRSSSNSSMDPNKLICKSLIENCSFICNLELDKKEIFIEYTDEIVSALIKVIKSFQKNKSDPEKITIIVQNPIQNEVIKHAITEYFPQHYEEIQKRIIFLFGTKSYGCNLVADIKFSETMKSTGITLSKENKVITKNTNGDTHSTVLGDTCFSEGVITWYLKIGNGSNITWICIGVMKKISNHNNYADNQSNSSCMNIRGNSYDNNNMTFIRPVLAIGDILKCTLDFGENKFSISCGQKFNFVGNDQIVGSEWYPMVILYYSGQNLEVVDNDEE